jgi:hypothetical protein
MFTEIAQIVANVGGLIGLVVMGLLVLVAYLASSFASLLAKTLKVTEENDKRLIDLKKAMYEADRLPDRRQGNRNDGA